MSAADKMVGRTLFLKYYCFIVKVGYWIRTFLNPVGVYYIGQSNSSISIIVNVIIIYGTLIKCSVTGLLEVGGTKAPNNLVEHMRQNLSETAKLFAMILSHRVNKHVHRTATFIHTNRRRARQAGRLLHLLVGSCTWLWVEH